MKKLFQNEEISMEESETMGSKSNADVSEVIAMEEMNVEIAQEESAIAADMFMYDETNEVIASMEEVVCVEEAIIASGVVSKAAAEMSIVARNTFAKVLGVDEEALSASMEDAEEDALATMKISMEEKKSWVRQAVEAAIKLFTSINAKIRKIIVKVLATVTGLEKMAKALEAKVNKVNDAAWKASKFSEEANKSIVNKLGIYSILFNKKNVSAIETAKELLDACSKGTFDKDILKDMESIGKAIASDSFLRAFNSASNNKIGVNFINLLKNDKIKSSISDAAKKALGGKITALPVRIDGVSGKFLMTGLSEEGEKAKLIVEYVSADLTETDLKAVGDFKVGAKRNAVELAKAAAVAASTLKSVTDEIFKTVDAAKKQFTQVSKETTDEATEEEKRKFALAKKVYLTSPKVAFGRSMGLFQAIRISSQVINEAIKASGKKEEK